MKDVIIIVPYLKFIKKAKKEEGDISHLNILKLINEPTTFAITYELNNYDENKIILIFELARGTYDVSLLKIENKKFQVSIINGNSHLGCEDFDN